ncbi:MAG: DMT family transporter [Ktedonobacteraceae bacterium]|nr:DMT family transporter [Ktedonobacteraceae bacterium]
MKFFTFLLFLLNTLLFATSYSVSKEALGRIDPIVFTFFVLVALLPVALGILLLSWHSITRQAVKSGFLLGSCLCLGLFMIYGSLKYNSATSTAFFPALNGFLAALLVWLFLHQPLSKSTWIAGPLSFAGALLIIASSPLGAVRGAVIAFGGSLFCTFYVFLADHEQRKDSTQWPLLGIELLTMAAWACLIVLVFGDWNAVHPALPKDIGVILYIGIACTFLPTLITVRVQKHISPITVAFIYVLEPVLSALVAFFYLHETLPLVGYLGGVLVVAGSFLHTLGNVKQLAHPSQMLSAYRTPQSFALDSRSLRQMGIMTYTPTQRRGENARVQKRRIARKQRLAHRATQDTSYTPNAWDYVVTGDIEDRGKVPVPQTGYLIYHAYPPRGMIDHAHPIILAEKGE